MVRVPMQLTEEAGLDSYKIMTHGGLVVSQGILS